MGLQAYKFEPVLELDSEDIESSKSRNSCCKQKTSVNVGCAVRMKSEKEIIYVVEK